MTDNSITYNVQDWLEATKDLTITPYSNMYSETIGIANASLPEPFTEEDLESALRVVSKRVSQPDQESSKT